MCTGLHAVCTPPAATAGSCADSARPELHSLESARPRRRALTARALQTAGRFGLELCPHARVHAMSAVAVGSRADSVLACSGLME